MIVLCPVWRGQIEIGVDEAHKITLTKHIVGLSTFRFRESYSFGVE
jgi:hypothetical protein